MWLFSRVSYYSATTCFNLGIIYYWEMYDVLLCRSRNFVHTIDQVFSSDFLYKDWSYILVIVFGLFPWIYLVFSTDIPNLIANIKSLISLLQ